MLISIGGLDYSSDLRELKELPNLPKERIVYEAHSYPWQKVTKVVNVALPGAIPGNASGKTHPGSLDDVWQTCTTLGDACAGQASPALARTIATHDAGHRTGRCAVRNRPMGTLAKSIASGLGWKTLDVDRHLSCNSCIIFIAST